MGADIRGIWHPLPLMHFANSLVIGSGCRYPGDMAPTAVDALRKLAGHWPDRELAVSLNRMRCKTGDGETWTTVRVREMRERLSLPEYDPASCDGKMISLAKAAAHFGICVGSAKSLVLKGI